ncbi:hypothetical protein GWK47_050526 [Chionoecetes opilio]|uniref:Uncharacterized protein n=1 Tax=Chionoecetes opilio TaxID=41210 RepID=A0A8J5CST9_CHIOP|nr:hypothetical protein GWK47_050526 [Chionoecetes opilio]
MAKNCLCSQGMECFLQGWLCWRLGPVNQHAALTTANRNFSGLGVKTWTKGKNLKESALHFGNSSLECISSWFNMKVKHSGLKGLGTFSFNWTALSTEEGGVGHCDATVKRFCWVCPTVSHLPNNVALRIRRRIRVGVRESWPSGRWGPATQLGDSSLGTEGHLTLM